MSNTITAYFKGRIGVAESVYQNDYGIVMAFDSIDLPAHFDCYFSRLNQEEALPGLGADNRVTIPNSILANPGNVTIHIPLHTGEDDSEVEYVIYFKVIGRARPIDDGTPAQMTAIERALALLSQPITNIEEIVNEALSFTGDTFDEMKAELQEDFDNYTETLEGDLATWKGGVESDIDNVEHDFTVLQNQFDTAVAAVSTDTELTDIRVGDDEVTYTTAGLAVRTQFANLKSDFGEKSNNVSLLGESESGYYRQATNGTKMSNADYLLYDFVPVVGDTEYYLGITSNTHICFWDANKQYISGKTTANMTSATPPIAIESLTFITPSNARYVSISANKAYNISLYPVGSIALYDDALPRKVVGNLPEIRMEDIYNLPSGVIKRSGANLLDKNVAIHGYYISEASGRLIPNASFASYYMPVESGAEYTTVGFDNNHYAILESDGSFISGGVIAKDGTISIPASGKYLGVTCMLSKIDNMAICKGDHAKYSDFGYGDIYSVGVSILEVGTNMQYTSISDAIDSANNGDIILIHAGTYHEAIDAVGKFVCIIGTSKDECILEYGNGDYSVAPLEMTRGVLKNLTIKAISEESSNKAYCLHNDNIDSANSSLYVENVKFINPDKACVGIGMRANSTLEFVNCEFIGGTSNAFYIHDWDSTAGGKEQNFIMKNCYAENDSANATIQMQSQEKSGAEAFALYQRNIVINKGSNALISMTLWNASIGGGGYLGSTDWTLKQGSAMNTVSQMNYSA